MKTLCNKSCRSCFIESRTVEFVFFRFFYNFISILQFCCLMRPECQDLNVNFFLHLGPVAQAGGDRGIFLKFFETDIYFWNFNFFKYKKEKMPWPERASLIDLLTGLGNKTRPSPKRVLHFLSIVRAPETARASWPWNRRPDHFPCVGFPGRECW